MPFSSLKPYRLCLRRSRRLLSLAASAVLLAAQLPAPRHWLKLRASSVGRSHSVTLNWGPLPMRSPARNNASHSFRRCAVCAWHINRLRFWYGRVDAGVRLLLHRQHALVRDRKLVSHLIRRASELVLKLMRMNLCRLLALLGIAVSIGPSIYHVLKPLRDLIMRISRFLLEEVIIPLVARLHRWGVFEAGVWAVSIALMLDSTAFGPDSSVFVALTSISIAAPALAYSAFVNAASIKPRPWNDRRGFSRIINAYAAATLAPLAVFHQSVLVGYFTVIAVYGLLGFSVACAGLYVFVACHPSLRPSLWQPRPAQRSSVPASHHRCYCIGFDDEESIYRVATTSLLLLAGASAPWTHAQIAGR